MFHRAYMALYRRLRERRDSQAARALKACASWIDPWVVRLVFSNPVRLSGLNIYWRAKGDLTPLPRLISAGAYQVYDSCIRDILAEGGAFVDIGAHIGWFSLVGGLRVGPTGKVWAFEPHPTSYRLLVRNIKENGLEGAVIPVCKAVSHSCQKGQLYSSRTSVYASLDSRVASRKRAYRRLLHGSQHACEVEITTLDDFFGTIGWPAVDLVKISVEGRETHVLGGMTRLAGRNPQMKILIDFRPRTLQAVGVSNTEFFDSLLRLGFRRFTLVEEKRPLAVPQEVGWLAERSQDLSARILCER